MHWVSVPRTYMNGPEEACTQKVKIVTVWVILSLKWLWEFGSYRRVCWTWKRKWGHSIFDTWICVISGGFRGGHSRPVPPLLKHFSINAPPFCTCAPPFETLKKKKKKKGVWFRPAIPRLLLYPPPPPPDVDGAPKKKVSESPPPPAYQLFWDLREFRGWRRSEKKTVCSLPPPFLKFLDPPVVCNPLYSYLLY